MEFIGWLLGIADVRSLQAVDVSLSAEWAREHLFWLCLTSVVLVVASLAFYRRFQQHGSPAARSLLGVARGLLLVLLLVTLAAPVLRVSVERVRRPIVFLVFDGTESMALRDRLPAAERRELGEATGALDAGSAAAASRSTMTGAAVDGAAVDEVPLSRLEYLQALLRRDESNLVERLHDVGNCRVEAFLFNGRSTSQLRRLDAGEAGGPLDAARLADALRADGQVTALGEAIDGIREQPGARDLAAVVLFSDFAHNSGPPPVGDGTRSPAGALGKPIYTVGLGPAESIDLSIELATDPKMKRAERTVLFVKLRQSGLTGQAAEVQVTARPLDGAARASEDARDAAQVIGRRTVTLASAVESVEFPFTPETARRFEFAAEVRPLDGETVTDNNRSTRQLNVIDDYLRLMYAAFEPTWEWRFIKDVFHRDPLVGMPGFRTYLSSSDPRVRQTNILFLPTLTPRRSDFFANDVIFIGDLPGSALTSRFGEMVKEFVGEMGGGLVIISGPRFGPGELAGTPLADLLPVVVDRNARLRDDNAFRLRMSPQSSLYPFMQLGSNESENQRGWNNLGELPWYQPVAALHEQGVALAEHPTDKCADGKTPQPLIAIRRFGNGEVVYLAFDELWRLRRKYGDEYYRQFWSQLIYRLGMSHALGADKRFVAQVDRQEYRVEDRVTLTVQAYDENYEPLDENNLPEAALTAEVTLPAAGAEAGETLPLTVPLLRPGVFETQLLVYRAGSYSIRVRDPINGDFQERRFEVTDASAESRNAVRNVRLQEDLARETGGRSYDLTSVARLPDDLPLAPIVQHEVRNHALWSTPLWFALIVGLMLGEWFTRRLVNLQ